MSAPYLLKSDLKIKWCLCLHGMDFLFSFKEWQKSSQFHTHFSQNYFSCLIVYLAPEEHWQDIFFRQRNLFSSNNEKRTWMETMELVRHQMLQHKVITKDERDGALCLRTSTRTGERLGRAKGSSIHIPTWLLSPWARSRMVKQQQKKKENRTVNELCSAGWAFIQLHCELPRCTVNNSIQAQSLNCSAFLIPDAGC